MSPPPPPAPPPARGATASSARRRLAALTALGLLVAGCQNHEQHSSGLVMPLPRHTPGDGLAVVNGPAGRGIHIWLDPDTSQSGLCRPRWNPDPARLQWRGPAAGPSGFRSNGRAPRQEFYDALRRGPVRLALRRQLEALCRRKAPGSRFAWIEPPRSDAELPPAIRPLWEEEHLLSHPRAVRRSEKQLLGQPLTPEDWDDRPLPRPPDGP